MASESVRYSQLINQLVLDRGTMDEFGRVEILWEYPQAHRVLGFICKSGPFDRVKRAFNLDQLDAIGENGIFVNSEPVETDAERVQQIESLIGSEVWTDMGDRLGRINDHVFDLKTGMVKTYLFMPGGLQRLAGPVYALYPAQVLGWGKRRVVVSAGIADQLEVYEPGVRDRVSRLVESLDEEKSQASQGLQSLMERAKNKARRARDKAQILAEQAREQAQELGYELIESAEQARERARDLRDEYWEDERYYRDQPGQGDDRRGPVADRPDDRFAHDFDDDFDFDAPWDESPVSPRDQARTDDNYGDDDYGDVRRSPLNLESKTAARSPDRSTDRPASPYAPRPQERSRDIDPWDDEWA